MLQQVALLPLTLPDSRMFLPLDSTFETWYGRAPWTVSEHHFAQMVRVRSYVHFPSSQYLFFRYNIFLSMNHSGPLIPWNIPNTDLGVIQCRSLQDRFRLWVQVLTLRPLTDLCSRIRSMPTCQSQALLLWSVLYRERLTRSLDTLRTYRSSATTSTRNLPSEPPPPHRRHVESFRIARWSYLSGGELLCGSHPYCGLWCRNEGPMGPQTSTW